MDFFTRRNAAILALVQAGVVVAGVLGAGAAYKWYTQVNLAPPRLTVLATDYGFVALTLPLAWVLIALVTFHREDESGPPALAFLFGLLLLAALLVGAYGVAA